MQPYEKEELNKILVAIRTGLEQAGYYPTPMGTYAPKGSSGSFLVMGAHDPVTNIAATEAAFEIFWQPVTPRGEQLIR